ncbi:MAG: hypothetical protein LAO04_01125 [Acidobacteriia bacterium]|nr:hypothetical protein [Terriglobia bacterium]
MKNRYFGDINDYRKYGLLRILSGGKRASVAVCWMLTADKGGGNGKKIGYLHEPKKWDHFDKNLFYALHQALIIYGDRNVTRAESEDVLSPEIFSFFKPDLPPDLGKRREYFRKLLESAASNKRDLVFFDPDNGLKTNAAPHERVRSVKFLYLDELEAGFKSGFSVLLIQFLPFANPSEFVDKRVRQIFRRLDVAEITCFHTPNVVFFLIPQAQHSETLRERSDRVKAIWHPEMRVVWHPRKMAQGADETTPSEA